MTKQTDNKSMAVLPQYQSDVEAILSHRHDHGADFWTTPDKRLIKGAPFSALECALYLLELGADPAEPPLKEVAALIFEAWKPDGRFKLYPKGQIFPCQTAHAARTLCALGYAQDHRVQTTLQHLREIQYADGGWRCEKFYFGRGPETAGSNPGTTLTVLDAFRRAGPIDKKSFLDQAVEFLLWHWTVKRPVGPCQYGIGTLFMQVEYPFRGYNLFEYVYVLSFYEAARKDSRFCEAFAALQSKTVDGQIVVERAVPKLAKLNFCKKGQPSVLATRRFREIVANMEE